MFRLNHSGTVMALAAVTALLFSIAFAPTALANDQEEEFDMNDRLATEKGASGSGKTAVDGDSVEFEVNAKGLLPDHQYEMKITIVPQGFGPTASDANVVTCGPVTSNSAGDARFRCDIDLVQLRRPGAYRLDLFVTHIHPTVSGGNPALSAVLDRDPLLACQPAPMVMVPGSPMDPADELDVTQLEADVDALAAELAFVKDLAKRLAAVHGVLRREDVDK